VGEELAVAVAHRADRQADRQVAAVVAAGFVPAARRAATAADFLHDGGDAAFDLDAVERLGQLGGRPLDGIHLCFDRLDARREFGILSEMRSLASAFSRSLFCFSSASTRADRRFISASTVVMSSAAAGMAKPAARAAAIIFVRMISSRPSCRRRRR
jgi:hypothetical protein